MPGQFPLLERVKGKSAEQLKALEESFQRSSSPKDADLGKDLRINLLVLAKCIIQFPYINIGQFKILFLHFC